MHDGNNARLLKQWTQALRAAAALGFAVASGAASAVSIDLADKPLFSTINVPGNLILALSVEWPTASTPAYPSTTAYSSATEYLGYFDPNKCYRYVYNATTPSDSYFTPDSAASAHACTTTATVARWSGNYLNWSSTQTLDTFRWALTGGPRARTATLDGDTATLTIFEKTRHSGQGARNTVYPDKVLSSGVAEAAPFGWSGLVSRVHGLGTAMYFSNGQELSCSITTNANGRTTFTCNASSVGGTSSAATCNTGNNNPAAGATASCTAALTGPGTTLTCSTARSIAGDDYSYSCTTVISGGSSCSAAALYAGASITSTCNSSNTATIEDYNGQSDAAGTAVSSKFYRAYIRVKACDPSVGLERNCKQYGSNYKPEGLLQQYAMQLRYSTFGYLNHTVPTGTAQRDGAVMRARMKSIGPLAAVPGTASTPNPLMEWDASTGVMFDNPDPSDASSTAADTASEGGYSIAVNNSGVMNYLNKFGKSGGNYKSNDPASELYYAAQRYLRNLGNVSEYANLAGAGDAATLTTWVDGFPVIKSWTDPVQYTCQKNFILGVGDVYTHRDANLPGSTMPADPLEQPVPSAVSSDTSVDVKAATDMVGTLEGLSNLGSARTGSAGGTAATHFISGLAYDAHTRDIRSDLLDKQTISTYWLDVLEGQTYVSKNQYWLAAKYGGFAVPDTGFSPYGAGNGPSTLTSDMWTTSGELVGTDPRPDNYFVANNADSMVSGLSQAFAKISTENAAATGSAFATPTPKIASTGTGSYATSYDPKNWSGKLEGSLITFDASGNPTLTLKWNAATLLDATAPDSRKIVTCCTSAGAALPFRTSDLDAATLSARTYYTSFGNVPGVAAGSQSAGNFVAYLRGDRTKEIGGGGVYRRRAGVLGDIVNSKANPVGPPSMPYLDLNNPGYSAFKRTHVNRPTVVYVGANDGMMHAFDATMPGASACASCGTELFAYVPSFVYGDVSSAATSGLASLGNPSYAHHYFVDATPQAFDVDFKFTSGSTSTSNDWRTVLIGGLGKGGKGYYAIDVTDPAAWTSETAIAGKVLWEFTDARMGYSYGDADVVKTKKYGWVVVLSSGYNNSDGKGYLFLVNPRTGALLEAIETPQGSATEPINLAHLTAYVPDYTNFTADAVYGGDLRGNVWRFDLTATSGNYPQPTKIAVLNNAAGSPQPVTTRPLIEVDSPSKKRYVLMGTGRLLADSDIANSQTQSVYAIIDGTRSFGGFLNSSTLPSGVSFPIGRGMLNANTDLLVGIGAAPANPMGWFVDLNVVNSIGERVNVATTANDGVFALAINLPDGEACDPAGTGRVMAVTMAEGKSVLVNGTSSIASFASSHVIRDIGIVKSGGRLRLLEGDATGLVSKVDWQLPSALTYKRLNWREVPTVN